ncbi:VaFE repeat-containing surface-anchored protein [Enterococcus hulanensis]|uniref:VaFE repeat-containing surface-anchored protein n=1 Tax=Enterococcus hulanensis TaxID=2559929 RepID=UPI001A8FCDCA|nr:VaFE repeat-containing surface-anchored protein [Enterococcus hulanensis]MBO0456962.1 VaFE repeat-containing surface-anchored protein [Enterococcus hulanensis]
MKTRIIKILGKMTRVTAVIFMVLSSLGFNGLSMIVEAKPAGGNTGYGQNAYGYMFEGGVGDVRTISYATGGNEPMGNSFMFCTESGKYVSPSSNFTNANKSVDSSNAAAIGAFMYHVLVAAPAPDHTNHAAMSYFTHTELESSSTTRADFLTKFNSRLSSGNSEAVAAKNKNDEIRALADNYYGPYTLSLGLTEVAGSRKANMNLSLKSAASKDMKNVDLRLFGGKLEMSMTGGQFVHKTTGASTGTISLNNIAELDNYTANQGPAHNPLNITAKVTKLPGHQMQRYAWDTSQNMVTAYTSKGLSKEASASIQFKEEQKTFAPIGTTVSKPDVQIGQQLSDQVTISVEDNKAWPTIVDTQTPVPASFEIDWYYSPTDYGNQKFNVNSLPADVTKLPNTDTFTVNAPGVKDVPSANTADKQGFYYPVLKLDKNKQNTPAAFEKGFQAQFNEENEKTKVIEKFAVQGTTVSKVQIKEGDSLEDKVSISLAEGNWPNVIGTNNKVPVKFQIDWYYSATDYGTQKLDVNSLPGDISFIGSDTQTVTAVGDYTVTSQHKSTGPGFYYPVLKVVVADQANQEHFTKGFQAPFNDDDEKTITKWQPKVKTETTVAQLGPKGGKVADKLTVTDNKDGHQLVVKSTLYGPYLTKPDFIQSPNQHDGGSTTLPPSSKVAGTVTTTINGNGTFTTPEIEVTEKGWYVWVEEIESTTYTEEWHSNFGSSDEYVVVPWVPNIETTVSDASGTVGAQIYDTIKVLDLPGMWGLPIDGKGNLNDWDSKNPELIGKDRDPDKNGDYNLPDGWGTGEETAEELTATFTMYYSPTKPIRDDKIPAGAEVFDVVKAPLISGELRTTEFKAFDKAGWYTIVVTGGSDSGRLAKFQTDYGIPSETVHVPSGSEEEFYTQVNEENVFSNKPVYDTLHVNKALTSDDAEVTFTLYKYSDKANDFDYSNPTEVAKSSKGMPIKKYGEYKSNVDGYGLEDVRITEQGTYGWVAKVVDTKTGKVIYEGNHGDPGEVFNVHKVNIHTKASSNDIYLGEPIHDTVILETTVPDGYYVIVDLYKFSDKVNDFSNAENATAADIVWTSEKIKVSASGEYKTGSFTPKEVGSYGYVEKLYDDKGKLVHTGKKGEETENVIVRPKIEIGTSAKDRETDINEGNAMDENGQPKEEVTIVDTVSYKDLVVGRDYTVKGVLMDKSTGQAFVGSDGKKVTAEKTFKADKENGTIDLEFVVKKTDMRGKTVVVFEKLYEGEKEVAVHEEITDEKQTVNYPEIETNASDVGTGTDEGNATEKVTIKDIVSYKNLVVGREYTVKGVLMDKETDQPFLTADGQEVRAEKKFTAEKKNGTIELEFVVTKGDLAGKTVVVFEKLFNQDKEVGSHTDIEDDDQTVSYPKVGTKAAESSIHGDKVVIEDNVSYENLIPGKEYTVKGKLMDKSTGNAFLDDGKEVTGETTFKAPDSGKGIVKVTFTFDRSALKDNKELVVFERLYGATGKVVATHEDIDDEDQTVPVQPPAEVKTSAKDQETGLNLGNAKEEVTIVDTVSYKNLIVGKEYTVKGVLMDKGTNQPFKTTDGKTVKAEKTFTAEKQNGTIDLEFKITKGDLAGKSVVVFETLYLGEREIASHTDINDENQTVDFPEVETKAIDKDTEQNEGLDKEEVIIVDTVSYKNLQIGKEYTVKGVLMDKKTNQPFLTTEGKEVRAEKTFTAEKKNGTIDLEFVVTKGDLAGKTVVVFENLYHEDVEVGAHTDIEDEDQSVNYPKVGTKAAETSIHGDTIVLEDNVAYENLKPGQQYKVDGVLMDKATGQPFLVNKEEVTGSATFNASKTGSGTVKVKFTFKRSALKENQELVVFEKLYGAKGVLVGTHEDINDKDQTVEVKPEVEVETTAIDKDTEMDEGLAKEEVKIIDTVEYKNLNVGQEYTVKGVLMDKATGNPFLTTEGKEVHAEKTFTAEKQNGTIELEFVVTKGDLAGKTVVVFEKLYHEDKEVGSHTDINDEDQSVNYPDVGTKASETSVHGDTVTIKDIVSYDNLVPGKEYKVTGVLMDKETGEAFKVDDKEITGEATFTANKKGTGTVEVEFTFSRKALEDPKNLVVFEKLYNSAGKLVGTHEDISDKDQTVEIKPEIELETDAIDQDTEMDEGLANERVTIVDTVSYKHLNVGQNYTVKGVLMDKATGKPFLTREGDEVHAQKTFKAEKPDGTIDLEFVIKRGDLAGKTVVVFETLYHDEKEVAAHTDIEDEDQTVTYPKVGTQASQTTGSTDKDVKIKDIVSYQNLVPGKEYTVNGVLMNKETGKPFIVAEKEVTSKATFKASETGSGTVEVEFVFPRSEINEDTVLVVFEKLYNAEGKLVGVHEDLEDEDQTVRQPQVSTKAKDKDSGTNEGFADDEVIVVDEVSYKNLIVGKEYTVKGVLMDKATNKPFLTRDGNEVHAEKTFKATKRDGTIELEFKITKGDLAGKTVVVFETLYQEEKEVASHTDIEDKDQSVHYPKVGTQAAEISKDSDEDVIINDIIFYENLIPGESYTVRGTLMMKEANAPFTVLGREVESQATFVASDTGTGTVEMRFTFRRSLLSNDLTLVAFEKLFDAKGNLIGSHEDINDEAQTVTIKKTNPDLPSTKGDTFTDGSSLSGGSSYGTSSGGTLPQTGEQVLKVLPYIGLVIIVLAGALYFYRKRQV